MSPVGDLGLELIFVCGVVNKVFDDLLGGFDVVDWVWGDHHFIYVVWVVFVVVYGAS